MTKEFVRSVLMVGFLVGGAGSLIADECGGVYSSGVTIYVNAQAQAVSAPSGGKPLNKACVQEGTRVAFAKTADNGDHFKAVFQANHPFMNDHKVFTDSVGSSETVALGKRGPFPHKLCHFVGIPTHPCNDPKIVVGTNSGPITLVPGIVSFPEKTTVTVENNGPSPITIGQQITFEPSNLNDVLSCVNKHKKELLKEQTCQIEVTFTDQPKQGGEILVHYGRGGVAAIAVLGKSEH